MKTSAKLTDIKKTLFYPSSFTEIRQQARNLQQRLWACHFRWHHSVPSPNWYCAVNFPTVALSTRCWSSRIYLTRDTPYRQILPSAPAEPCVQENCFCGVLCTGFPHYLPWRWQGCNTLSAQSTFIRLQRALRSCKRATPRPSLPFSPHDFNTHVLLFSR